MKQRGRLSGLDTPGFDDALWGLLLTRLGYAQTTSRAADVRPRDKRFSQDCFANPGSDAKKGKTASI